MPEKQRLIAYIDGFNLYFGLKSKDWRRYYWLKKAANASFVIGRKKLASSQFPDPVATASGYVVERPETWR